jgi:hypothetical protein
VILSNSAIRFPARYRAELCDARMRLFGNGVFVLGLALVCILFVTCTDEPPATAAPSTPPEVGPCQGYACDSAVIRYILDVNEHGGVAVSDVAAFEPTSGRAEMLTLEAIDLSVLPPQIGNLTALTYIDLSRGSLSALPAEIGHLSSLRTLWLNDNNLLTLPPQLGDLDSLAVLNASRNCLASLPPEIGLLHSLRALTLAHNQLSALPSEIGDLISLEYLDLDHNCLQSLPQTIGGLVPLEILYLVDNELTTLPAGAAGLSSLVELDLRRNALVALPDTIAALEADVFVCENHLTGVSTAVAAWLDTWAESSWRECQTSVP